MSANTWSYQDMIWKKRLESTGQPSLATKILPLSLLLVSSFSTELYADNRSLPVSTEQRTETEDIDCKKEHDTDVELRARCSDCYDGWALKSLSVNSSLSFCTPDKIDPRCLKGTQWIGRQISMCGECGIEYSANDHTQEEILKLGGDVMKALKRISCEEYRDRIKQMKEYCGDCLREKLTN